MRDQRRAQRGSGLLQSGMKRKGKSLAFLGTSLFLSQTKRMKLWFRGKSDLQPPGKRLRRWPKVLSLMCSLCSSPLPCPPFPSSLWGKDHIRPALMNGKVKAFGEKKMVRPLTRKEISEMAPRSQRQNLLLHPKCWGFPFFTSRLGDLQLSCKIVVFSLR